MKTKLPKLKLLFIFLNCFRMSKFAFLHLFYIDWLVDMIWVLYHTHIIAGLDEGSC